MSRKKGLMMFYLMLPVWIFSYIAMFFLETLTNIIGWILIPPMAVLHPYTTKTETSVINGRQILNWKYDFMWIWSNQEDGILSGEEFKNRPDWFRIIYWSALRNPSNNLRFVDILNVNIDKNKVRFKVSEVKDFNGNVIKNPDLREYDRDDKRFISFVYQGIYSNLRIHFKFRDKLYRFWIGFKIYPHDVYGLEPWDHRKYGAGFSMQFKYIWPRERSTFGN
jgi:hypothetical protein